ncbi:hypothetical protein [Mesorhizobium sp. A623]
MSAFMTVNYGDRIEMLTDGAVYEPDGTLLDIREKVYRLTAVPAALTSRGEIGALDAVGLYLDTVAMVAGFDGAMERLPSLIDKMKESGAPAFEAIIAGISEQDGPVVAYFSTVKAYPEFEPFMLYRIYMPDFGGGAELTPKEMIAAGLTPGDFKDGLAGRGADVMELMRKKKGGNPTAPDLPEIHGIGGHVDLTVIRADGVTTTRLRTWPDQIGQKINPFTDAAAMVAAA